MTELNTALKYNILLTRPEKKSAALAQFLVPLADNIICQPLFDYQISPKLSLLAETLQSTSPDIAIFVSESAVHYAFQQLAYPNWPNDCIYIAVGMATANALTNAGIKTTIYPHIATSEGLLALDELKKVAGKSVLIFRGDTGRELIYTALMERKAKVRYVECYQKHWRSFNNSNSSDQWRKAKINCIVVTSNDILLQLWNILSADKEQIDYWQQQCVWCVISDRVAQQAKKLGITRLVIAKGAHNQAIYNAIAESTNGKLA